MKLCPHTTLFNISTSITYFYKQKTQGLNNVSLLKDAHEMRVDTVFGEPSSALICGELNGVDCVLLNRHDKSHRTAPSQVNYRANLLALRNAGCHLVLATTACGSLHEAYRPGDLAILDDLIDRTTKRHQTYHDGSQPALFDRICHMPMYPAFSAELRRQLIAECERLGLRHHASATMVTVEGPRFSSRAESRMFQRWGAHTINMTTCPEAVLAKELGLPYAAVAIVTDYDCWREHDEAAGEHVDVESVLRVFRDTVGKVTDLLVGTVARLAQQADWPAVLERYQKTAASSLM
jgi:5'-methylthioadenosine phosphorylase